MALVRNSLAVLALLALWGGAASEPAIAHEIGTTRVTVRFPTDDTFRIEVVTDAQALLEKLEAIAGADRRDTALPDPRRFVDLQQLFLDRVAITFDSRAIRPEIQAVLTPPKDEIAPPVATMALLGHVPAGARQMTWRYGWTFSTYSIEVQKKDGDSRTEWLEGEEDSTPIPLDGRLPHASGGSIFWQYLGLGFTHIVPKGLDHIFFVLGLFLLSANQEGTPLRRSGRQEGTPLRRSGRQEGTPLRRSGRQGILVWQVSAFTVAHTLTLGLAMNGVVAAPPSIVEPLIALSIAYVAVENVFSARLRPWRVALVFAFGLLHGLGFAGVLGELGLPSGQFIPALLAFNLGVEGGQLTVIAAATLAVGWWRTAPFYRQRIVVPASMTIACVAIYWTAQRLGY